MLHCCKKVQNYVSVFENYLYPELEQLEEEVQVSG
jgi:hypothetical protein